MAEYHQYCPVARATEILADRWTPLIVRELLAGCQHFNAIERGLPGISRSLLAARLRVLEDAGVIVRRAGDRRNRSDYVLTDAGRDLERVLDRFGQWGVRWAFGDPRPGDVRHSQADSSRLHELFPDVTAVPLAEGLTQTVEWFRSVAP